MKILIVLLASILTINCARQTNFPNGEWIDLTYEFSEQTLYWTPDDGFKKETVFEGRNPKGFYYSAYKISAPEHGGTHLDSPIHFAEGKQTVDQIPLENLIAPAIKVDVSAKAASNRDYLISVEDLTAWEAQNGKIPDASIILFQTGYGKFWGDRAKYMGVEGDKKHFPGLSKEAATWLITNRKPKAVGIDTASIDAGNSETFDAHVALMTENIPAFENVANIEKVPTKGATVISLPMKIKSGSGAPLRIVAFVAK